MEAVFQDGRGLNGESNRREVRLYLPPEKTAEEKEFSFSEFQDLNRGFPAECAHDLSAVRQRFRCPPGGRRPMGHRLQQFLPFGRIIDLGEFLRQIQVIPAEDAILDEPFLW